MSGNEMKFIQEAFDTNWVVPLGPNVNGFEKDLEGFVNQTGRPSTGSGTDRQDVLTKRVVALCSGTAAVHLGWDGGGAFGVVGVWRGAGG